MREMATTGDLTRKIALSPNARWEDEDARLLANTFNTMTDSIARFQREAAQRERLSSLGRLSTVVAHEIRNPLMIIRTALRTLKQGTGHSPDVDAAIADIDEEVTRLNRIVTEVLDFARPIKFDLAPVDLNALCEDAVRAVGSEEPRVRRAPRSRSSRSDSIVTDGERVRLALVNMLTNARHAVLARSRPAGGAGASDRADSPETPHPGGVCDRGSRSGCRHRVRTTCRACSIRFLRRGAPAPDWASPSPAASSRDLEVPLA